MRKTRIQDIKKEIFELFNRKISLAGETWHEHILKRHLVAIQAVRGMQRRAPRVPHTRNVATMVRELVRVRLISPKNYSQGCPVAPEGEKGH